MEKQTEQGSSVEHDKEGPGTREIIVRSHSQHEHSNTATWILNTRHIQHRKLVAEGVPQMVVEYLITELKGTKDNASFEEWSRTRIDGLRVIDDCRKTLSAAVYDI